MSNTFIGIALPIKYIVLSDTLNVHYYDEDNKMYSERYSYKEGDSIEFESIIDNGKYLKLKDKPLVVGIEIVLSGDKLQQIEPIL